MTATVALHIALIVFACSTGIPQITRLITGRDVSGLSPSYSISTICQGSVWCAYGALSPAGVLWLLIAVQGFYAMTAMWELYLLIRFRSHMRSALLGSGAVIVAAGLALAVSAYTGWGWAAIAGLGGIAGTFWKFGPPVVAAYRSRDPFGVSWITWAMIGVRNVFWIGYGAAYADLMLMIGALPPFIAGVLVVARVAATRGRRRADPDRGRNRAADANCPQPVAHSVTGRSA